jgi:hypothetical protein
MGWKRKITKEMNKNKGNINRDHNLILLSGKLSYENPAAEYIISVYTN